MSGRGPRWPAVAILAATLVVGWPLLLPRIYDTHDGHYALYNAAQLDGALRDGQVPVRWLPDLFGGRGLPHFLYYHPLAFYCSSLLHASGLGFIAAIKGVYLLSLLLSGLAMYRWLRHPLPPPAAAVGAVAYVLAPFRAVEIHVKGDPPAALAFVFLPLVLLSIRRAEEGGRGGVPALALSSAGLVLSHSVTAVLALPGLALYAALAARPAATRGAARIAAGVGLGAALAAFHWLPAIVERGLVHIDSPLGILFFDFREHFVAAWQWLSPLWGYHGSFAGSHDDMSFQIGPIHAAGVVLAAASLRGLGPGAPRRLAVWSLTVTVSALACTLSLSRPLWEGIPVLRIVQFPWRWLAVVALGSSAALATALWRRPGTALLCAALIPPTVTAAFALAGANPWYWRVAALYATAAMAAGLARRVLGRGAGAEAPLVCALLAVAAIPWTAVPLHSAWRGEPAVVPITERDLAPERVRLGIRRTTARDDYLPRTVQRIPPRDPRQEYRPPPGAREWPDALAGPGGRLLEVHRRSHRFDLEYEASAPFRATLNLHDFPGWRATLDRPGGTRDLPHSHDEEGRVVLDLPEGQGWARLRFERTAPRAWGDALGAAGLVLTVALGVRALRPRPR